MEVILLQRVSKLGTVGKKCRVKPGFARNFLIPQKKALPATPGNLAYFESRRAELEKEQNNQMDQAKQRQTQLDALTVTIGAQAGEEGRLFGSVSALDIVKAMEDLGHKIVKSEVRLPLGPIRQIGEYEVELHLQGGLEIAKIKVVVTSA